MDNLSDLFFIIVGTAAITAFLVATLIAGPGRWREPQVIYVQTLTPRDSEGFGCLLALLLAALVLAAVAFGR